MPANFQKMPDGTYNSPLSNAINTARFSSEKSQLMRHFDSEEEMLEYLANVDQVTGSLRDHIWTLN